MPGNASTQQGFQSSSAPLRIWPQAIGDRVSSL